MITRRTQTLRERPMLRNTAKSPLVVGVDSSSPTFGSYKVKADVRNDSTEALTFKLRTRDDAVIVTETFEQAHVMSSSSLPKDEGTKSWAYDATDVLFTSDLNVFTEDEGGDASITIKPRGTVYLEFQTSTKYFELVNVPVGNIYSEGQLDILFQSEHILQPMSVNDLKFLVSVEIDQPNFAAGKVAIPAATKTQVGESEKGVGYTVFLHAVDTSFTFGESDITVTNARLEFAEFYPDASGNALKVRIGVNNIVGDVAINIATSAGS